MSLKDMTKEELELLSHKDITNLLLEENGKMNTKDLFKQITELLDLPNSVFETKIGDYYTSLTTDKRFVLLEDGNWDLRNKHTSLKITSADDEEEEDDSEDEIADAKDDMSLEDDEDDFDADEDDYDNDNEDLKDLIVIDEDELELEE